MLFNPERIKRIKTNAKKSWRITHSFLRLALLTDGRIHIILVDRMSTVRDVPLRDTLPQGLFNRKRIAIGWYLMGRPQSEKV